MEAVLALSGGADSATLLGWMLASQQWEEIRTVSFDYGSKHGVYELRAAGRIAEHYKVSHHVVDMREPFSLCQSNLLLSGGSLPEGHYAEESMRQTVVPGRNLMFLSVLAGYAESIGFGHVMLGVHAGDHFIYPDCRPAFVLAANMVVEASTAGRVSVHAPFLNDTKQEIIAKGLQAKVPYQLTRTCYKHQPIACGRCGSCQERLEAFALNSAVDPLFYESRDLLPKK